MARGLPAISRQADTAWHLMAAVRSTSRHRIMHEDRSSIRPRSVGEPPNHHCSAPESRTPALAGATTFQPWSEKRVACTARRDIADVLAACVPYVAPDLLNKGAVSRHPCSSCSVSQTDA